MSTNRVSMTIYIYRFISPPTTIRTKKNLNTITGSQPTRWRLRDNAEIYGNPHTWYM